MNIICQFCGKSYPVPDSRLANIRGRTVECPACKKQFVIDFEVLPGEAVGAKPEIDGSQGTPVTPMEVSSPIPSGTKPDHPETIQIRTDRRPGSTQSTATKPLPIRTSRKPTGNKWLIGVAIVIGIASLAIVLVLIARQLEPEGRIVIDAPDSIRAYIRITVAERKVAFPATGEIVVKQPPGKHWVVVERPGFRTFEQLVQVENGKTTSVQPGWISEVESPMGTLVLDWPQSDRFGARLIIDGRLQTLESGNSMAIRLDPGPHDLIIRRNRQVDCEYGFEIVANRTHVFAPPRRTGFGVAGTGDADDSGLANPNSRPVRNGSASTFDGWFQSFTEAQSQARIGNKLLLVLFDGSDWCGWSQALHRQVLDAPRFRQAIEANFVLVHVDFPRYGNLPLVENANRNAELARYYGIGGFPSVLITDAEGQPVDMVDFQADTDASSFLRDAANSAARYKALKNAWNDLGQKIRDGKIVDPSEIYDAIPGEWLGYYLPTVENWYQSASEADPGNLQGILETIFQMRWISILRSPGKTIEQKADQLNLILNDFLQSASFRSADDASRHYRALARIFQRFDTIRAVEAAKLALAELPADTDPELGREVRNMAEGVLNTGTGFIISDQGIAVTNAHVVGLATEVSLTIGDSPDVPYLADVLHRDPKLDLAVIRIRSELPRTCSALVLLADSATKAETFAVFGYPGDAQYVAYSRAEISQPANQRDDERIVFDGTVNPGNSGGPLVSQHGLVGGVVFAKTQRDDRTDSMGLAIPADVLIAYLQTRLNEDEFRRIVSRPGKKTMTWTEIEQSTTPAVIRIVNRRLLLDAKTVQQKNQAAWQVAVDRSLTSEEYESGQSMAMEVCQAIPSGVHLCTLGALQFRCGQIDEAFETLITAAQLNEEDLGTATPADIAFLALALHKAGKTGDARALRRKLDALMSLPYFADDPDNQTLAREVSELFEMDPAAPPDQ